MRRALRLAVVGHGLAVWLIGAAGPDARALSIPPAPRTRVADAANVLPSADRQRIEARLADWERESSNQIVVATFPSLEGEDPADFSNRLFEAWKLGDRQRNNGVLLAVFLADRKVKIEVGYGLEARLTDALSRRIIEAEIAPHFRAQDYAGGIEAGCEAIILATRGEYVGKSGKKAPPAWLIFLVLFALILFVRFILRRSSGVTFSSRGRRRNVHWGSGFPWGGFSGGGGFGGGSGGGNSGGGFSGGGGLSGGGGATGSW